MTTTQIEWADRVWNPITGCTKVSPGCANCYAERMAHRLQAMGMPGYDIATERGRWTGAVTLVVDRMELPLKWKPARIFVNSMSDLFHPLVPDTTIDWVFEVMRRASWHTFIILTKRAQRMREYMQNRTEVLENVWLGVSLENQTYADERLDYLYMTPAALKLVSAEPLLGPINLGRPITWLGWVIAGAETGPGARPMHLDWVRSLRDQCQYAGVPFFLKRLAPRSKARSLDGREWNEYPKT